MPHDIKTDWDQDVLNHIVETSIENDRHGSRRDKQIQAKQAVDDLLKDKQVKKAVELLAAE